MDKSVLSSPNSSLRVFCFSQDSFIWLFNSVIALDFSVLSSSNFPISSVINLIVSSKSIILSCKSITSLFIFSISISRSFICCCLSRFFSNAFFSLERSESDSLCSFSFCSSSPRSDWIPSISVSFKLICSSNFPMSPSKVVIFSLSSSIVVLYSSFSLFRFSISDISFWTFSKSFNLDILSLSFSFSASIWASRSVLTFSADSLSCLILLIFSFTDFVSSSAFILLWLRSSIDFFLFLIFSRNFSWSLVAPSISSRNLLTVPKSLRSEITAFNSFVFSSITDCKSFVDFQKSSENCLISVKLLLISSISFLRFSIFAVFSLVSELPLFIFSLLSSKILTKSLSSLFNLAFCSSFCSKLLSIFINLFEISNSWFWSLWMLSFSESNNLYWSDVSETPIAWSAILIESKLSVNLNTKLSKFEVDSSKASSLASRTTSFNCWIGWSEFSIKKFRVLTTCSNSIFISSVSFVDISSIIANISVISITNDLKTDSDSSIATCVAFWISLLILPADLSMFWIRSWISVITFSNSCEDSSCSSAFLSIFSWSSSLSAFNFSNFCLIFSAWSLNLSFSTVKIFISLVKLLLWRVFSFFSRSLFFNSAWEFFKSYLTFEIRFSKSATSFSNDLRFISNVSFLFWELFCSSLAFFNLSFASDISLLRRSSWFFSPFIWSSTGLPLVRRSYSFWNPTFFSSRSFICPSKRLISALAEDTDAWISACLFMALSLSTSNSLISSSKSFCWLFWSSIFFFKSFIDPLISSFSACAALIASSIDSPSFLSFDNSFSNLPNFFVFFVIFLLESLISVDNPLISWCTLEMSLFIDVFCSLISDICASRFFCSWIVSLISSEVSSMRCSTTSISPEDREIKSSKDWPSANSSWRFCNFSIFASSRFNCSLVASNVASFADKSDRCWLKSSSILAFSASTPDKSSLILFRSKFSVSIFSFWREIRDCNSSITNWVDSISAAISSSLWRNWKIFSAINCALYCLIKLSNCFHWSASFFSFSTFFNCWETSLKIASNWPRSRSAFSSSLSVRAFIWSYFSRPIRVSMKIRRFAVFIWVNSTILPCRMNWFEPSGSIFAWASALSNNSRVDFLPWIL